MKKKVIKQLRIHKKHGKYFCSISIKWITFLTLLAFIAVGNLLYRHYTVPKVLGISTSIYHNCAFWDVICPFKNFFYKQDSLRKIHIKIPPTLEETPATMSGTPMPQ